MRIRFTNDPRPTQSFHDVRVLTRLSLVPAFSPSNWTWRSTRTQQNKSLNRVTTTAITSQQAIIIFSTSKEVDTIESVCAGFRPAGVTEISKRDDKSRKVHAKLDMRSTLQHYQVDEQDPERENLTLIRDNETNLTANGDGRYDINGLPKVKIPRNTPS